MSTSKKETYDALVAFIEENQNRIYRLAYSYVKSKDTALDIVQEAIFKAIKAHERLEEADSVKPWFYKILVNVCMDELRRGSRVIAIAPEDLYEGAEDSLAGKADSIALHEALEQLETKTKTVIVLRYFEDLKLSDIADLLGENISSVKSRLYRGLRALKIQLQEEEMTDGR